MTTMQENINETIQSLRTQSEQWQTQGRELVDELQGRGKTLVDDVRKTVESEYAKRRAQAAELQTKAQSLIQARGAAPAKKFIVAEVELFDRAEDLIGQVRTEVNGRAEFLAPAFDAAEQALSAVRSLDSRAQALLDKVFEGRQLPLNNYDDLNVQQVTKALKGLSRAELKVVEAYEARNKARKTVMTEIAQLLAN